MANEVLVNPKFTLKVPDFLKGALLAAIAAVVPVIQGTLESGELVFNLKAIVITAGSAFLAYLVKNYFSKPSVTTTYNSNEQAKVVAEKIAKENQTVVK